MKAAVLFTVSLAAFAQLQDNREKKMTCDQRSQEGRHRSCKITEQTLASAGRLTADPSGNGSVTVKGWNSAETLVRTKVEAWAPSDSEATLIAGQVQPGISSGQLRASGPESKNNSGWSVSYEVFVPHATDLTLNARNGGIHVTDVRGRIECKTTNGGVHMARVAGDVNGVTQNGGVHVELAGTKWDGGQMNLRTQNGGVHVAMPDHYSAHIQTETVNGGIHSDFPMPAASGQARQGARRPKNLDFNLGSGGGLIHLSTANGGVHLERIGSKARI